MSQIQVLGVAPQASVETLDSFTSGPPVPDKNFVVSDSEVELASAITPQEGASPNLPPRNGDGYDNFILLRQTNVIIYCESSQANITCAQKHLIFWPLTEPYLCEVVNFVFVMEFVIHLSSDMFIRSNDCVMF